MAFLKNFSSNIQHIKDIISRLVHTARSLVDQYLKKFLKRTAIVVPVVLATLTLIVLYAVGQTRDQRERQPAGADKAGGRLEPASACLLLGSAARLTPSARSWRRDRLSRPGRRMEVGCGNQLLFAPKDWAIGRNTPSRWTGPSFPTM
jgi:hypothetical protein